MHIFGLLTVLKSSARFLFSCGALVLVLEGVHVAASQEHSINVEDANLYGADIGQVPVTERLGLVASRASHGRVETMLPLHITLRPLEPSVVNIGYNFSFEVTVQNVGQQAVPFPVSPNPTPFRRSMTDARVAGIYLDVTTPLFGQRTISSVALYGASEVPNSIVTLQPGETILIRGAGDWWQGVSLSIPSEWTSSTVQVRPHLRIQTVNGPYYLTTASQVTIPVQVSRP